MSLEAGTLVVRPGAALPTIHSTRREIAPLVGRGRNADELPDRLAMVFSLCGGAHRVAAAHAVAAARGAAVEAGDGHRRALQLDTLRELLRRLWLDAPRLVSADAAPDPAELAGCPLLRRDDALDDGAQWIETRVLGQPHHRWLAEWEADPRGWAATWAAQGHTWPARWLDHMRHTLGALEQRVVALAAHASAAELQRLAATLAHESGFAMAPLWRGGTAETGCWTRLADLHPGRDEPPHAELWMRHAARIADLARLVGPVGGRWLSQGGLALGERAGLGWCEMARGLLVHTVRLDGAGLVADNRLVAPTEWNFHPFGPAARALAMLDRGAGPSLVRAVVAAYDPCVSVTLADPAEPERA